MSRERRITRRPAVKFAHLRKKMEQARQRSIKRKK
jgi:hypothetical protein